MTLDEFLSSESDAPISQEAAYRMVAEEEAEASEETDKDGCSYAVVRDMKTKEILFAQPLSESEG